MDNNFSCVQPSWWWGAAGGRRSSPASKAWPAGKLPCESWGNCWYHTTPALSSDRYQSVSPTSLGTNLGRCWASPPAPSCWRRWGLCPPASTCPGDGSRPPVSCLGSVSSSADIWIAQYWFSPRAFPLSSLSHLAVLEKNSRLTWQYSHSSSAAEVLTILTQSLHYWWLVETNYYVSQTWPVTGSELKTQHWLAEF